MDNGQFIWTFHISILSNLLSMMTPKNLVLSDGVKEMPFQQDTLEMKPNLLEKLAFKTTD